MHLPSLCALASAAITLAFQSVIYTLQNNAEGANILSMAVDGNTGKVSTPVLTSTGGKGLRALEVGPPFGPKGSMAGPDGLFGQNAVVVSGNVSLLSLFMRYPR